MFETKYTHPGKKNNAEQLYPANLELELVQLVSLWRPCKALSVFTRTETLNSIFVMVRLHFEHSKSFKLRVKSGERAPSAYKFELVRLAT